MKNSKSILSIITTNILFECGAVAAICFITCAIANVITISVMHIIDFLTRWKRW